MVKSNKVKYQPQTGDLVFAKVRGHRFWPARVESACPDGRKPAAGKFAVFFFGTYESAVVTAKDMIPYEPNKEKHGSGMRLKDFATAMKEIAESPDMTIRPPDLNPHPGLVSETISETKGPVLSEVADDGAHVPDESLVPQPASKKRKRSQAVVTSASKSKKKKVRVSSGSSEDVAHQKVTAEAVALVPVAEPQAQKSDSSGSDKSEQKRQEKLKAKAERKEKKKAALKAEKRMKKRQERLNQLKSQPATEQMLRDVDAEIIESLSLTKRDALRCLQAMGRLDLMAVTPALLLSYPNILVTIRKCRKYLHDEQVRKKADYLHHKYKSQMFSDPSKLDPETLMQLKAKQANSSQSSSKTSSDHSAGRDNHCSSQSQSPAASEYPAADRLTPAANAPAALPSHSMSEAPVSSSTSRPHASARSRAGVDTDAKQESVAVTSEKNPETVHAAGTPDDAVLPIVAAVMEKITDAVVAAERSYSDVAPESQPPDATGRSDVVAGAGFSAD